VYTCRKWDETQFVDQRPEMKTILALVCLAAVIGTAAAEPSFPQDSGTNLTILVTGDVAKSGTYAFREGMTLTQAIASAGGFTVFADVRVRVLRATGGLAEIGGRYSIQTKDEKREFIRVNVRKIKTKEEPDILLKAGDWIAVGRTME